ncbi:hypothetical protein SAMN05444412_1611, partial [Rhodonellum ikkaensis]
AAGGTRGNWNVVVVSFWLREKIESRRFIAKAGSYYLW